MTPSQKLAATTSIHLNHHELIADNSGDFQTPPKRTRHRRKAPTGPPSLSTTLTQLDSSIENVEPPKKKRRRQVKKNIGKCTDKPHVAAAVNVNDACIAGKDIGMAQSSAVSSSQSATRTNEQAKVNLCTIKTLKAENEHLLKKVNSYLKIKMKQKTNYKRKLNSTRSTTK